MKLLRDGFITIEFLKSLLESEEPALSEYAQKRVREVNSIAWHDIVLVSVLVSYHSLFFPYSLLIL